jgi:uncharacterized membrane protein
LEGRQRRLHIHSERSLLENRGDHLAHHEPFVERTRSKLNEAELPKPVQEEVDARARGPNDESARAMSDGFSELRGTTQAGEQALALQNDSSGSMSAKASERELINTRDEKDRSEESDNHHRRRQQISANMSNMGAEETWERGASAPTNRRGTVADENIRTVARLQEKAAERRTRLECAADRIVAIAGRESTVAIHAVFFALWIGLNIGVVDLRPFDPFPFVFLTMIVSLEAIFLTLFVLATQNRMTLDADRRAHLDLQVNLLSEQEMTLVLQMLREVCEHLGLHETTDSPKFRELVRRTDVTALAAHVERAMESNEKSASREATACPNRST